MAGERPFLGFIFLFRSSSNLCVLCVLRGSVLQYFLYSFHELVKSQRHDGFDCRGVRPGAHYRASATRPYVQGAQKLRNESPLQVRRNDKVAAQRRRWTFYETISFHG
jgi:hypothetical protein